MRLFFNSVLYFFENIQVASKLSLNTNLTDDYDKTHRISNPLSY